ncbi:MAG: HD domain-containing phosphohydrolase [Rhodospirillaceae bacterium]
MSDDETVLLVDDDPRLLVGLRRALRKDFAIDLAEGADEALERFKTAPVPAVIVADMRMPGRDGLSLLREIHASHPETVRIMLTGNADQQTAMDAINHGQIFRFYAKPCPAEVLGEGIAAALTQHRLLRAEQDLLEKTLAGSVKVLMDVLSMVDPIGFGRSNRLRDWADLTAQSMALKQPWKLRLAAMFSQLGVITLPPEITVKLHEGKALSETEAKLCAQMPAVTRDLVATIPRLGVVAEIVYQHQRGFDGSGPPEDGPKGTDIPLEARLLHILVDLEQASEGGPPDWESFQSLAHHHERYDPALVGAVRVALEPLLEDPENEAAVSRHRAEVAVGVLLPGHVLAEDLLLANGHLVLAQGVQLTKAHVHKIRAFAEMYAFQEPVAVYRDRVGAG